jgi:hypothetical protein
MQQSLGPVEFLVVVFEGNQFKGEIIPALTDVGAGTDSSIDRRKMMRAGRAGRPSLIGTMARTAVIAGTATAVSGAVAGSQQKAAQQKTAAQQAQAAAQQAQIDAAVQQAVAAQTVTPAPAAEPAAPAPAAPAAALSTDDKIAQLQQLGQLHQSGILSDAEFAAMKAKILG